MTEDEAITAINNAPSERVLEVAQDVISRLPDDLRDMIGPDLEEMAALRQEVT